MSSEVQWAGGMRWSGSLPAWMGFFAQTTSGRVLLRHELRWIERSPEEAADEIVSKMKEWKIPRLLYVAANPQLWPSKGETGESIKETFISHGVPLTKGTTDWLNGLSRLRSWLVVRTWPDGAREPSLLIHPDCKYFLRTFPTLVSDDDREDLIALSSRAYPCEGAMHYAMSRPSPILVAKQNPLPPGAIGHLVEELRQAASDEYESEL